jgi:cell division protein FtsI/penicillin-binding protein 2
LRLSLDLDLQRIADDLLGEQAGAAVLLNYESGEILAMSSFPTFDANQLAQDWDALIRSEQAPLLNRATQGRYAAGGLLPVSAYGLDTITTPEISCRPPPITDGRRCEGSPHGFDRGGSRWGTSQHHA